MLQHTCTFGICSKGEACQTGLAWELSRDHMNWQVNGWVTFATTCVHYRSWHLPVRSSHIFRILLESDKDCQVHKYIHIWQRVCCPKTICHAAIEVGMGTNAFPSSFGCVDQATSAHAERLTWQLWDWVRPKMA